MSDTNEQGNNMRTLRILTGCLCLFTLGAQSHDLADIITAAEEGHIEAQYILEIQFKTLHDTLLKSKS